MCNVLFSTNVWEPVFFHSNVNRIYLILCNNKQIQLELHIAWSKEGTSLHKICLLSLSLSAVPYHTVTLILNLVIEKFKYTDGMMESLIKVMGLVMDEGC